MSFTGSKGSETGPSPSSEPETAFLSLPNGCLCCSIKEPGIAAIENMIVEQERAAAEVGSDPGDGKVTGNGNGNGKGKGRGVDRVVVELTGVADPGESLPSPLRLFRTTVSLIHLYFYVSQHRYQTRILCNPNLINATQPRSPVRSGPTRRWAVRYGSTGSSAWWTVGMSSR